MENVSLFEIIINRNLFFLISKLIFLIISSLLMLRLIIIQRIGSLKAIMIVSYFRFFIGIVLFNIIYLTCFQLLLLIKPYEGWIRFILYIVAVIISYPIIGFSLGIVGLQLDGGKAIKVLTSRYSDLHPIRRTVS